MNISEYENYHETVSHTKDDFPYNTYLCSIPLDFSDVPMHWHDEIELIYIKKGRGMVQIDFNTYTVTAGELALILPGQLHGIMQYENDLMEYENIMFHPNLLLSKQTDICTSDFLEPLFARSIALPCIITKELTHYDEIMDCINNADEICKTYPPAYQFGIKSALYQFLYLLFCYHKCQVTFPKSYRSLDKMKQIIKYIECNYMNKITIADISSEVGLSESHFMKYFKKTMGTSFIDYLNDYRLTMASRLLVTSENSVLEIAIETGFENLSYFIRLFKKKYSMTPNQYRKSR